MKSLGIPSVILFGLPEEKDEMATGAWDETASCSAPPGPSSARFRACC